MALLEASTKNASKVIKHRSDLVGNHVLGLKNLDIFSIGTQYLSDSQR